MCPVFKIKVNILTMDSGWSGPALIPSPDSYLGTLHSPTPTPTLIPMPPSHLGAFAYTLPSAWNVLSLTPCLANPYSSTSSFLGAGRRLL